MKRITITRGIRLERLRLRNGGKPRQWLVRLKPGDHIKLPSAITRALDLHPGDQVNFEPIRGGRLSMAKVIRKR